MLRNSLYFLLALLLVASCKTTTTPSGLKLKNLRAPSLVEKVEKNQKRPQWFASKYKGKVTLDNKRVSISGNIRMQSDSLLWLNVKVFGFEVARAQINQDSVWFVNRYQNEYYQDALPSRYMQFSKKQLYVLLEDIITNQIVPLENYPYKSEIIGDEYALSHKEGNQSVDYFVDPFGFQVTQAIIKDQEQEFNLDYALEDFNEKDGYSFSNKRKINVDLKENHVKLDLNLSNIIVDVPQKMPFSIPSNYTRIHNLSLGL